MKHFLTAVFALAALSSGGGCAIQTAETFAVSDEFSPEQLEAITAAAEEWCEKSSRCPELFVVPAAEMGAISKSGRISIGTEEQCYRERPDGTERFIGGFTHMNPFSRPHIIMCKFDENFGVYVTHELGHALSGRNDHTHEGVMSAPWDKSTSLTSIDVDYVHGEPVLAD